MRLSIRNRETLVYHDGPVLFIGADEVDTLYLCAIVERTSQFDKYLCAPVSKKRLARLRRGLLPVRSVFDEPEQDRFAVIEVANEEIFESPTTVLQSSAIPEDWFPAPDFFYRDVQAPSETVVRQAKERQRAVVHVRLEAPESMGRPVILAPRLGHALTHIASFVKHAYSASIRTADKTLKDILQEPENSDLNVFKVAPGSFVVHLESVSNSDMLGHVHISRALRLFDEINATLGDKDKAVEVLRQHRGRVAQSYKRLLQYVVETDTPVSVQWATPGHNVPEVTAISKASAEAVYEKLLELHELDSERRTIIGVLLAASVPRGTWRVKSDSDGKEFWGDIDQQSDATLEGVTLETVRYKLVCAERIEEDALGKEKLKLSLVSIQPVNA